MLSHSNLGRRETASQVALSERSRPIVARAHNGSTLAQGASLPYRRGQRAASAVNAARAF
eukprot:4311687-Alexandrium_andersonii.AAC.1